MFPRGGASSCFGPVGFPSLSIWRRVCMRGARLLSLRLFSDRIHGGVHDAGTCCCTRKTPCHAVARDRSVRAGKAKLSKCTERRCAPDNLPGSAYNHHAAVILARECAHARARVFATPRADMFAGSTDARFCNTPYARLPRVCPVKQLQAWPWESRPNHPLADHRVDARLGFY